MRYGNSMIVSMSWSPAPDKDALLALIRDQLGEFDCLAICSSGLRDPLIPGNSMQPSMELPTIHPPISAYPLSFN